MRALAVLVEPSPSLEAAACLDPLQFNRTLQTLLPSLSRYAQSLSRNSDTAQDLVQDAVLRAWRSRTKFAAGTNMKAWLFCILRNGFLNQVRHRRVAKTDTYGDHAPQVAVPPDQEMSIVMGDVQRLWVGLTPEQRRAIELVGIDGESYEHAAAIEGVSVGTMKSRAARGRQALKELVNGERRLASQSVTAVQRHRADPVASRKPIDASPAEADRAQVEMLRAWGAKRAARGALAEGGHAAEGAPFQRPSFNSKKEVLP